MKLRSLILLALALLSLFLLTSNTLRFDQAAVLGADDGVPIRTFLPPYARPFSVEQARRGEVVASSSTDERTGDFAIRIAIGELGNLINPVVGGGVKEVIGSGVVYEPEFNGTAKLRVHVVVKGRLAVQASGIMGYGAVTFLRNFSEQFGPLVNQLTRAIGAADLFLSSASISTAAVAPFTKINGETQLAKPLQGAVSWGFLGGFLFPSVASRY